MSNFIKYCIASAFLIGVGLCIYFISAANLTARESGLISVVLTILSVLAAWIVTHMYSQSQYRKAIEEVEESHRTNLRTYALKAAEKVSNLSTQLNRLAVYLEESLEESDDEKLREDLLSKKERITSAIHIINTLKSVNDTALSDWDGVIGEELNEQRALQDEREEYLGQLIDRLETVSESQIDTQNYAENSTQALSKEVDSLRKDLRSVAVNLGLSPIRLAKVSERKPGRETVKTRCPACGQDISYEQRANPKSLKSFKCQVCDTKLFSRYDPEKGFIVAIHRVETEQVTCPSCGAICEVSIDTYPHSSVVVGCHQCKKMITVKRDLDMIRCQLQAIPTNVTQTGSGDLTEEIIQLVKDNLPPQPWPPGVGKEVALKLGLTNKLVAEAIQKLVRRGEYNLQFDGKLYVPKYAVRKQQLQSEGEEEPNP